MKPIDLHPLKTHDVASRPCQLFHEDLGQTGAEIASLSEWMETLPRSLLMQNLQQVCHHLVQGDQEEWSVVAGVTGPVLLAGCGPYLIDWLKKGLIQHVAMDGLAAMYDLEMALVGKTGEEPYQTLPVGKLGMTREAPDALAVAALQGAREEKGLGTALGSFLDDHATQHPESSLLLAAHRMGVPCTVHVTPGLDPWGMHAHISQGAIGEATHIDFRRLCNAASGLEQGMWLNLGGGLLTEVFCQAFNVVCNLGRSLEGLVCASFNPTRSSTAFTVVRERLARLAYELDSPYEVLLPLLHQMVVARLAASTSNRISLRAA